MNLKSIPPHTLITGVAAIAWLGSFFIRAFKPDFALGAAADALMTTCVGYWLTANHKAGDGGDLLGEVVNKVGIPMISKAHAPPVPTATPVPTAPVQSVPVQPYQPPVQSKPSPPSSQGGLPWGP